MRPRLRWKDDIKVDLKGVECYGVDWIHVNPVAVSCEYVSEPSGSITNVNFLRWACTMELFG